MAYKTFIQWNCRGLRANIDEIHLLIQKFSPIIICLQEIMLKSETDINLRQYSHFLNIPAIDDSRPNGGVSIFILKCLPHSEIKLNTCLQAVAVRVGCHRPITVCSVYIPPNSPLNCKDLDDLLHQLPPPVLFMGDFNPFYPSVL